MIATLARVFILSIIDILIMTYFQLIKEINGPFANKNPSNQFMDQRGLVISLKENYILKSNISAESPAIWPHLSN